MLKHHVESKHEGVHYACEQCPNKYIKKYRLKLHVVANHEGGQKKNGSVKYREYREFCMKFAKNNAKLTYLLNGGPFLVLNDRKTKAGLWPKN